MTIENNRALKIALCIALAVSVFLSISESYACFCGKDCLHGLQNIDLPGGPFHGRCPGAECKSCNLEVGKALKARSAKTQTFLPDSAHRWLSVFPPEIPDNSSPGRLMSPIFDMIASYFPPLFLLCHSIRC
jgi:hypothetical protein